MKYFSKKIKVKKDCGTNNGLRSIESNDTYSSGTWCSWIESLECFTIIILFICYFGSSGNFSIMQKGI